MLLPIIWVLVVFNTLEQMAKVKAVVPETVFPHGYAVLNADDDLVYKMKDDLIAILLYSAWMKTIHA